MLVVFLGAPGAGKGTQAARLAFPGASMRVTRDLAGLDRVLVIQA